MMLREKGMAKGREIKFSAPSLSTVWRQILKYYLILIINNTTFLGQGGPLVLPLAEPSAGVRKSWIPSWNVFSQRYITQLLKVLVSELVIMEGNNQSGPIKGLYCIYSFQKTFIGRGIIQNTSKFLQKAQ